MTSTDTASRADEYTTLVDGKFVPVSRLTLAEAQEALCDAIDLIEMLDDKVTNITERIKVWRAR